MKEWIRNNLVLVSSVVLPVLLIAGFFVLGNAPRMLADPPRYNFLLSPAKRLDFFEKHVPASEYH